jgi:CubicO group peptidase (beta-lactamase class C family)
MTDYSNAIAALEKAIRAELADNGLHGMAAALIDDQQVVYAAGFGEAHRESVFRAGSISKLFNAVAVMQLVEQGRLDLDEPLETYGRELLPIVPFDNAAPITLRQLLCHRSGMIRESPVGGYFDAAQPSLAVTVASVRTSVLVNRPGTKTRYSNVGPSVAGHIVATVAGREFEDYQQAYVLGPLGMKSSSFLKSGVPRHRLATGHMQAADGRGGFVAQEAPVFDLGTLPAGNLFTSVDDLARFVSMLAADGRSGGKQIVSQATLAEMWKPQLIAEDICFGLGFKIGKLRGHKTVSHNGAVYGHSTALVFLPETKIGVVLLCNDDIVNGIVGRLAELALNLMLEAKTGERAPAPPATIALAPDALTSFAGQYESATTWAEFEVVGGRLVGKFAGHPVRLRPIEPAKFLVEGRAADGSAIVFEPGAGGKAAAFITAAGLRFNRVETSDTGQARRPWDRYLGAYGPPFIPLVVSVRHGHLYAMTENLADYRLTPVNRHVFAFPEGLYADEHLVFLTDLDGKVCGVNLANMVLPRGDPL